MNMWFILFQSLGAFDVVILLAIPSLAAGVEGEGSIRAVFLR